MTADREREHQTMRRSLTAATIACDLAAQHTADPDERALYAVIEITLREAGDLLNALDLSVQKARRREAACVC